MKIRKLTRKRFYTALSRYAKTNGFLVRAVKDESGLKNQALCEYEKIKGYKLTGQPV